MTLKKNLKISPGQTIVEYILVFTALCAGILFVFGAFAPEKLNLRTVFNKAVDNAIAEIKR